MMRSQIEFEVREPTGLGLGTYDIFMIRQKIYIGELHDRCQYLAGPNDWRDLPSHPALAEVLWLLERTGDGRKEAAGPKTAPKIAGWQSSGAPETTPSSGTALLGRAPAAPDASKQKGLLGRFFGKK